MDLRLTKCAVEVKETQDVGPAAKGGFETRAKVI
jgi:hypothetical protein